METLEITVGEGAHVAARLDDEAVLAGVVGVLGGRQVLRNVAANEVALACSVSARG